MKAVTLQGSFGAVCFPTSLLAVISLLGSCCNSPKDIEATVAAGLVYLLAGIAFLNWRLLFFRSTQLCFNINCIPAVCEKHSL